MNNDIRGNKNPIQQRQPFKRTDQSSRTSWGKVAGWYNDLIEDQADNYQKTVVLPNLMRLVAPKAGERVLDLACGQGFFSREMARAGAKVTGVDISPELIAKAKVMSPSLKIDFRLSAAHELEDFDDQSFDKIVTVLAIQNIHNPDEVFRSCERVLSNGGPLHLVMNHPAFRIPQSSSWGFDDKVGIQYRRIDKYLSEHKIHIQMRPGSDPSLSTLSYHRPMQAYFKWLRSAGFNVRNIEEWISDRRSDSGPRAKAENVARKEIPLFMYLEAVKSV